MLTIAYIRNISAPFYFECLLHYFGVCFLKVLPFPVFLICQKMEEANPLVEPTDMEGEQLVTLVNKAVAAITTRVQSKSECRPATCTDLISIYRFFTIRIWQKY